MAKVIMTSVQLVERLEKLAARKTFYKNKYPYNLCYINTDGRTSADCSNLYKALFNGYDVNKTTIGYYQKDLSNTGDCTESGLINQCTDVSTNFTLLKEGVPEVLYMSGHIGGYIGKVVTKNGKQYNVIECTPSFGNGIVYSWVDSDGTRRAYKGGSKNGKWTKHGKATKWVQYVSTATVTPVVTSYPTLKKGSKGDSVKKLQTLLVSKGYNPKGTDGIFGNDTEAAVKAFQKANGLTADGIVGSKTWAALTKNVSASVPTTTINKPVKKDVSKYPTIKKGSSGSYVKELQNLLVKKGYNPKGVDGIFGAGCDAAVKKYQKDHKLTADGIVGQRTWDSLFNG